MKRIRFEILAIVLAILLCGIAPAAIAENIGVQLIGGPELEQSEVTDMDDIHEGDYFSFPDYCDVEVCSVKFEDHFGIYFDSGDEADFLYIELRILNTQKVAVDFLKQFGDVTCDFGNGYQFAGWVWRETRGRTPYEPYESDSSAETNPLYDNYYAVLVTLPNYVVESKEPLSVTFTIGKNTFTCNVRN